MSDECPVILIEDDYDDLNLIQDAYRETGCAHPLKWFMKPDEALDYLKSTLETPFMIVADVNMPVIDGLALRRLMRETKLQTLTAVPFFYLSTSTDSELMRQGFELMVQGFFTKPTNYRELIDILNSMIRYSRQSHEQNTLNIAGDEAEGREAFF